jgi:nitrous oxidase accessory protein
MSNTGNGIHLWKCDSIEVRNNHMEGHRDGIYFEFAKHCKIMQNRCIKNFRYGLHFMFSDDDTYLNNTFQNNGTGVAVMYSKGITMIGNHFLDNWGDAAYGLLLKDISHSLIQGNQISNNTIGITMEGSSHVRLTENTFNKNGYALRVWANCINDTFNHNNFTANTFDASTNGELQLDNFDHNYWDKYQGYDLNKDGVGDIPFHPVSIYSMLIQQMPYTVMLLHSFVVDLLDRAEKNVPSLTPEAFVDLHPLIKLYDRSNKRK